MKVVHENKTYFVDWKYENPELVAMLTSKGITEEQYRKMKFTEVISALGVSQLPTPKFTVCFIKDENKQTLVEARTIRSVKDQFCKEVGRRYSLAKALRNMFPGTENKNNRKVVWEKYLNSSVKVKSSVPTIKLEV